MKKIVILLVAVGLFSCLIFSCQSKQVEPNLLLVHTHEIFVEECDEPTPTITQSETKAKPKPVKIYEPTAICHLKGIVRSSELISKDSIKLEIADGRNSLMVSVDPRNWSDEILHVSTMNSLGADIILCADVSILSDGSIVVNDIYGMSLEELMVEMFMAEGLDLYGTVPAYGMSEAYPDVPSNDDYYPDFQDNSTNNVFNEFPHPFRKSIEKEDEFPSNGEGEEVIIDNISSRKKEISLPGRVHEKTKTKTDYKKPKAEKKN